MNCYHCSSCDERSELKHKKSHLKSELHMNTDGTVINKYTIINPEPCELNKILKNNVNKYDKRFEIYKIICIWKLVIDNDTSIDVKSRVMCRVSVFRRNQVKYLKNKTISHGRQGSEFSYIAEMNNTFVTRLDFMTNKH